MFYIDTQKNKVIMVVAFMSNRLIDFPAAPLWWTEDDAEFELFHPTKPPPRSDSCPALRSRPVPSVFYKHWWPHCQRLKGGGHCHQCGHDVTAWLPFTSTPKR